MRSDLIRSRLMPVVFGVVIALMARESCSKQHRTHATFVFDYGTAESSVQAIDAELWINGERQSQFHRAALEHNRIGPTRFDASLPVDDGELRVDVELANGDHRRITRTFHADDGATITVPLERELH